MAGITHYAAPYGGKKNKLFFRL